MFSRPEVISIPTPVIHDILQEKRDELERLTKQTGEAVDLVNSTIHKLEGINQQFDSAMSEIDEHIQSLTTTRTAMSKQRSNNAAIIVNFSKLLETGDGE